MSSKIFAKDHYCAKFQAVFSLFSPTDRIHS